MPQAQSIHQLQQIMNSCFTISLSLSLSFFFVFVQNFSPEAAPTYLYYFCPHISLFTPNSTYESNLNTVLSSLSSNATNSINGFANATAGQNPPDQAHGLFLCRGDVSTSMCSDCMATGKQAILRRCRNQRVAVIWYDECMLRYDNRSFFSLMETKPTITWANSSNITNPTRFAQVLGQTMDKIAARASNSGSGKKVAVEEVNLTGLQTLYTLAQCTLDITTFDCNWCLRQMISNLRQDKQGGRSFSLTCGVRFELFPFYNASAVAVPTPPPPQLPPRPPSPETRLKSRGVSGSVRFGFLRKLNRTEPLTLLPTISSFTHYVVDIDVAAEPPPTAGHPSRPASTIFGRSIR